MLWDNLQVAKKCNASCNGKLICVVYQHLELIYQSDT